MTVAKLKISTEGYQAVYMNDPLIDGKEIRVGHGEKGYIRKMFRSIGEYTWPTSVLPN